MYMGFCPTIPASLEDFQSPKSISSGTPIIDSLDFESATLSGFNLTVSGTGIIASGLVNSGNMMGSYYVGLASTGNSVLVAEPAIPGASGVLCGRSIILARASTASSQTADTVAFSFLRQSSAPDSNGFKISLEPSSTNTSYILNLSTGPICSSSGAQAVSSGLISNPAGFIFSSNTVRNNNRLLWLMTEWEVQSKGVLVNLYSKVYQSGDTISGVKSGCTLVSQFIFTGQADGANYYNSTSSSVAILLGSTSALTGSVGFDMFHLESLSSLPITGLNKFELFEINTASGGGGSGSTRPFILNSLCNLAAPPEGGNIFGTTNYLIPISGSVYGRAGSGWEGIRTRRISGDSSDNAVAAWRFRESEASGITHGVCRFIVSLGSNDNTKFGFSFLRQGPLINDNCYTIEHFRSGSNSYFIRLRKGSIYNSLFNDSSDFNGTILATSSALSGLVNSGLNCIEVRWQTVLAQTKIEILYAKVSTDLVTFDTSPGTLDLKFASALTYTDSSSAYVSTSESPVFLQRSNASDDCILYKMELRRAKY